MGCVGAMAVCPAFRKYSIIVGYLDGSDQFGSLWGTQFFNTIVVIPSNPKDNVVIQEK